MILLIASRHYANVKTAYLDEWSKAVGGARSVGHDVSWGVKVWVIDSNDICWDVRSLGWGCDQNLGGTCLDVLSCTLSVQEHSSTLNDQVNFLHQKETKLISDLDWTSEMPSQSLNQKGSESHGITILAPDARWHDAHGKQLYEQVCPEFRSQDCTK